MADIGKTVKEIWEQSMKAVNKAATNIATSTKQKVDEMNIVTRRKELQNQLGLRLYELWQAGEDVPETLKATLEEMRDLEVKLAGAARKQDRRAGGREERRDAGFCRPRA